MADPTGEADKSAFAARFRPSSIGAISRIHDRLRCRLLPYRELNDALGLSEAGADTLADASTGKNCRHRVAGLLAKLVFGRLAGYEDVNDPERLCRNPAMSWVVGDRAITESAASSSQLGRFETKWLSRPENLKKLSRVGSRTDRGKFVARAASGVSRFLVRQGTTREAVVVGAFCRFATKPAAEGDP